METNVSHRLDRLSHDWILEADPLNRRLLEAVAANDDREVLFLLRNGARHEARDRSGNTALILAVLAGSYKTTHILLSHGADPNDGTTRRDANGRRIAGGYTPLMHAAEQGRADLIRLLIEFHADPNQEHPHYGFTPLMLAARNQQDAAVEALVAAGADIHARDRNGESALRYARYEGAAGPTDRALKNAGATTLF